MIAITEAIIIIQECGELMRIKNVAKWLGASANRFPDKIAFSDGISSIERIEEF